MVAEIKCLLCTGHPAKGSTCVTAFIPHKILEVGFIIPIPIFQLRKIRI